MTIYYYITEANPYGAKALLNKYNISLEGVNTYDDVAAALEYLIASPDGEAAFKEMMDLHPDKDAIIQLFGSAPSGNTASHNHDDCDCKKNKAEKLLDKYLPRTDGISQTGMFIIGGILIFALALSMKK